MPHRFRAMGCEVAVASAAGPDLRRIRALFDAADGRFSRFRPDSELNLVNARAGRMTALSPPFAEMLGLALWAAAETGGKVDPTLGEALELAGYDRDFASLPADGPPAIIGPAGSWHQLDLRDWLLRMPAGMRLDLNGVVKASTVDRSLGLLDEPAWVSAGGDLAARGPVHVALPGGGAVRLRSGGLATSGCGRRRWRRGGRWQHHLIDPATGAPAVSEWEQVTVAGASCLDADVAAKAAFLHGRDGPDWLDARGLPGRFLRVGGEAVLNRSWREALEGSTLCT